MGAAITRFFIGFMVSVLLSAVSSQLIAEDGAVFTVPQDPEILRKELQESMQKLQNFHRSDTDSTVVYSERVQVLADKAGEPAMKTEAVLYLGRSYYFMKDYERAIEYLHEAAAFALENGDHRTVSIISRYIGDAFKYSNIPDSAEYYAYQAVSYARQIPDSTEIARGYNDLGLLNYRTGNYINSIRSYIAALEYFQEDSRKARVYNNLGSAYFKLGDMASALDAHQKSYDLNSEFGYTEGMILALANQGRVNRMMNRMDKAGQYLRSAHRLSAENDFTEGLAWSLLLIGQYYADISKPDSAMVMFGRSFEYYQKLGSSDGMGQVLLEIGLLKEKEGSSGEALEILTDSREKLRIYGSIPDNAEVMYHLARNNSALKNYSEAFLKLDTALTLSREAAMYDLAADVYAMKAELSTLAGKHGRAVAYLDSALAMERLLIDRNNERYQGVLTLRTEMEEIRLENDLLKKDAEIDKLTLSALTEQRRLAIISGFAGLLVIVVLARQFRLSRAHNRELKQYSEKVDKVNTELVEALNNVKELKGLLPICSHCKKIRDDSGYWNNVEHYIEHHTDANFTHGICPSCAKELYPELAGKLKDKG